MKKLSICFTILPRKQDLLRRNVYINISEFIKSFFIHPIYENDYSDDLAFKRVFKSNRKALSLIIADFLRNSNERMFSSKQIINMMADVGK